MADRQTFHLEVISPERKFYEKDAWMVEFEMTEGQVGVYAEHIPMTAIVVPGVLRIYEEEEVREAALLEGFVEILPDKIVILSQACEWPEEIDINRAKEAKIRAERRIDSGDSDVNMTRAELALRKSLIRLELALGNKK